MTIAKSQIISICRLVQNMREAAREDKISSREEEAGSTFARLLENNETLERQVVLLQKKNHEQVRVYSGRRKFSRSSLIGP